MRRKKLVTLIGSVCLILVLAALPRKKLDRRLNKE